MTSSKKNQKNKSSANSKSATQTTKQPIYSPKKKPKKNITRLFLAALVLAIMTAFIYQGALDNEFVDWDDYTYVTENNLVRSGTDLATFTRLKGNKLSINSTVSPYTTSIKDVFTTVIALNYHPLTILTMRWNNNACPTCPEGISARPFIFWNIVLHMLNSFLVLILIYYLSKRNLLTSILVAAVFAFHPMHVESVAWVSERKDVLYSFFFLLGLLSYWNYLQKNANKWLYSTFILFILACLSKAMAVVFPLAMLLLYFWNSKSNKPTEALKDSLTPAAWIPTLPFFVCSIFFGAIALNVQAGGDLGGLLEKGTTAVAMNSFDDFKIMERIQFASYGFIKYIIHFFVPTNLSTFYPYPDQQTFDNSTFFKVAPILMLLILGTTLASLKFTRIIALGIGFYLITIILVLQFVSVGAVIMADRYTYLPYIGLTFMLVMLVHKFTPPKAQKGVLIALIFGTFLYIPKTITQIEIWQNSEVLWGNVIDLNKTDDNLVQATMARPLGIRGNYYGKQADKSTTTEQRQAYLDKAFKDFIIAARLGSKNASVYEGLGNTYGMRGNMKQEQARQLLQKNKGQEAQNIAKQANENLNLAIQNYSKSIELEPNRGTSYFNRGVTYSILRIHDKAIYDYTKTLQFSPEQAPRTYMNRGVSYAATQQNKKAIADFQQVLKYNPKDAVALRYLKQLTRK